MRTLIVLLLGIGIGFGAYWYMHQPNPDKDLQNAQTKISTNIEDAKGKVTQAFSEIDTQQIKDQLERTGQVVSKKTQEIGSQLSDATVDARVTATIKSKFALDRDLSARSISVNTTRGVVTLAGSVSSYDLIKKAMNTAIKVDGAKEVISTLQVK